MTDLEIKRLLDNNKHLVVLYFYSSSCIPCKGYGPTLEKIVESFDKDKITLLPINVEETSLTTVYGIRSVPTTVFVKDKETLSIEVGSRSEKALRDLIKKFI